MSRPVGEKAALRKALAAAKAAAKPGRLPLADALLNQANKGLKRGWPLQYIRKFLSEATRLVATAGVKCASASVPDPPRAKRDEQQRLKAARKARPGRRATPQDKPWDAVAEKQVAREGKVKAAFAELATLPPYQRDVVRSRLVKGKKLREVATELGISEDQASRRYKAGIETLRKQTGADNGEALPSDDRGVVDCGRRLPEVEDEESFDESCYSPDHGLIIVNRPNNARLSTRAVDATPVFERDRKSTKLNWLGHQ